jgi:hypothetical protein
LQQLKKKRQHVKKIVKEKRGKKMHKIRATIFNTSSAILAKRKIL